MNNVTNSMATHPQRDKQHASQNAHSGDGDFQIANFHTLTPTQTS